MSRKVTDYKSRSGRLVKEDGTFINVADLLASGALGGGPGTYYKLSTEPFPTGEGIVDGANLLEVDTGNAYVYYAGEWRAL